MYIEEPDAAAVLNGTLPTASGYRTLRSVPAAELRGWWTELAEALHGAGAVEVVIGATRNRPAGWSWPPPPWRPAPMRWVPTPPR